MSDRLSDEERARKWNVEPAAWDVAVLIAQRLNLCESTEWSGDKDIAEIADEVAAALAAKGREERERCAHACEEAFLPAAAAVVRALDDTGPESV